MREGELRNRETEFTLKLQDLESKQQVAVGSDLLLQGILIVGNPRIPA